MSDNEDFLEDEGEELDAELDAEDEQLREEEDIDALEEAEEEEKEPEPNPLNKDHLFGGALSLLETVGRGLSVAYVRLDVPKLDITDISMLSNFIHLRFLDVSNNQLTDITPVSPMTHLCSLNVSNNRLSHLHVDELPYLQNADFSHNKLSTMEGINHPMLEELILESNKISRISFPDPNKMQGLRILNLRGNKITSLGVEFPPNLEELYVAANMISTLEDMAPIPKLKKLNLRDNQIEKLIGLDGEKVACLTYLNLRGNNIVEARDIKQLRSLPALAEFVIQENPIEDNDDYREEVIAAIGANKSLKRLDKDMVDSEELTLATDRIETMDKEDEEAAAQEAAANAEASVPSDMVIEEEKSMDSSSEMKFNLNTNIEP